MGKEFKDTSKTVDRNIWRWPLVLALLITAVGVFAWLIVASYYYDGLAWTGFAASTNATGVAVPAKTLWDWLGLIVIPATLAAGGFWFSHNQRQRETRLAREREERDRAYDTQRLADQRADEQRREREEREAADERARETALQAYLDRMSQLLINHPPTFATLAATEYDVPEEWANVARIWTLTTLRRLDGKRKGIVVRFLYESNLIRGGKPVVSLEDADLTGAVLAGANFKDANFVKADLSGAYLRDAQLFDIRFNWAYLIDTDLTGAWLVSTDLNDAKLVRATLNWARSAKVQFGMADLSGAKLVGTRLEDANFVGAILVGADFSEADLPGADFRGAILTREDIPAYKRLPIAIVDIDELGAAKFDGAQYTPKTLWPQGFNPLHAGANRVQSKRRRKE